MYQASTRRARLVGFYVDASNHDRGFVYSAGTYTPLDHPAGVGTVPLGINDQGQVVGYYVDSGGNFQSFLDIGGTFTTLAAPSAPGGTWANDIGDEGQIVGYYGGNTSNHGFIFDGGTYTSLDDPSLGFQITAAPGL
jgi:hypothetical protein